MESKEQILANVKAAKEILSEIHKYTTLCSDEFEENIFIQGFISGKEYSQQSQQGGWISVGDVKSKLKYMWDEGVKWRDANCEFGGETLLPKFEYHLNIILPTIPNL